VHKDGRVPVVHKLFSLKHVPMIVRCTEFVLREPAFVMPDSEDQRASQ